MSSRAGFEVGSGSRKTSTPLKRQKRNGGGRNKGKSSQTWGAPNPEYPSRMSKLRGRMCIVERGVDMVGLQRTFMREAVETLGWNRYVERPNQGTLELVREFYASMNPELFYQEEMPVMVRGKLVEITAQRKNSWLGTADVQGTTEGLPDHEYFREEYDGRLAANLHINGWSAWDGATLKLQYLRVKPEAALWYLVVGANLHPTTHRTFVYPEIARLLFCIVNRIPINVGEVIMKNLYEKGKSLRGLLIFPCLITHFCQEAGVAVYEPPLTVLPHEPLVGRIALNTINRFRGFPPIPDVHPEAMGIDDDLLDALEEQDAEEDEDDDYVEADLEGDPDAETSGATLDDVMRMLREMNKKVDGLVTATTDLNNRTGAIQQALSDVGINVTYQRRNRTQ